MGTYKVLNPPGCYYQGRFYKRGDTLQLPDEQTILPYFIQQGVVEEVKAARPKAKSNN
jgi:hypothetical protein